MRCQKCGHIHGRNQECVEFNPDLADECWIENMRRLTKEES